MVACRDPKGQDDSTAVTPDDSADDSGQDDTGPTVDETACAEAEARLGFRACVHRISDDETFEGVTVASSSVDQLRVGKYLVPATDDARVPPVFIDTNAFQLHYDFLVNAFPDEFAGLTTAQYETLVLYPETREFYAGTYALYISEDGFYYGFNVWDDPADETSTVTEEQVTAAWQQLQERFEIGDLAFVPGTEAQETAALEWDDAPFEIENPADVDYEVYTPATGYGYLRLYTLDEFNTATDEGTYGYQDIVVIDEAPVDIERVVSGIVTGTRQGTLSHLNVRSASRGTPNCYIKDPLETLAAWKDQLVAFECADSDFSVTAATAAEAEAVWEAMRPEPVDVCAPDLDERSLPGLLELDTSSREQRKDNICTYGSKGSNLATLYQRIDADYQLDGFVIPFAYYDQFMREGTWMVDLGDGEAEHSFQETIEAWHADEAFLTDASVRADRLDDLRDAMDETPVNADVVAEISARIVEVFGSETEMVRLRSSSNAEDDLEFSGAGLYTSDSACVADELDGDDEGPSLCDPEKENEQTVTDAMQDVWGSVWNLRAWEERDWYGMDHLSVAMGLLCDTRSKDELANIVAFSGNPTDAFDDRYLLSAQLGEAEVVHTGGDLWPETTLVTLDDGVVTEIERVTESSEAAEVLSDDQVEELATALYDISLVFPNDYDLPENSNLIWDTEWKYLSDGQLIIKQIRPFLRDEE